MKILKRFLEKLLSLATLIFYFTLFYLQNASKPEKLSSLTFCYVELLLMSYTLKVNVPTFYRTLADIGMIPSTGLYINFKSWFIRI
jgi:hypothetical protein